jgi:lipoprotein-anchoring transpeptidase ErfK/SrfK
MRNKKRKYLLLVSGMPLIFVLLIYLWISLRFMTTYCYGTLINGMDCTGKSETYVRDELLKGLESYQLVIKDRDGNTFTINGKDIALKWELGDTLNEIKKNQNSFTWIIDGIQKKNQHNIDVLVSFDEASLKKKMEQFGLENVSEIVEPQNAYINLDSDGYRIIPDEPGNQINQDRLFELVMESLNSRDLVINLVELGCYNMAEITKDSQILLDTMTTIQAFESTNITYNFEGENETLTKEQIDAMIQIKDNVASISTKKVEEYIQTLKDKYDTVGNERDFVTSDGRKIKVSKGNYGWSINKKEEAKWLVGALNNNEQTKRVPEYETTALRRGISDIGSTYIEVDMTKQHMWFYQEGNLIIDTDVVTGNTSKGNGTPAMVAYVRYKERNATLNGENYSTPVSYWMPIYKNIGIHDASWRSDFGGQIYKTSGSHGCINTPFNVVKIIYDKVDIGTPVILYY